MPESESNTRANPCSPNPCYPGVECFTISANESKYICGECPPYMEGNGKFCIQIKPNTINKTLTGNQWELGKTEQKLHTNRCLDEKLNPCFDKVLDKQIHVDKRNVKFVFKPPLYNNIIKLLQDY